MKTIKKAISVLLSALIVISSFSMANLFVYASTITGSCGDGTTYRYEESTGKLIFGGSGSLEYCNPKLTSKNVESIEFGPQITGIGEEFFYDNCSVSKTLTVPDNIQYIGQNAFKESGLEKIVLPKQMEGIASQAFWGCNNLKTVVLPQKIDWLGNYIFSYCSKLEKINFPEYTCVPASMFLNCVSLTSVNIPQTVTSIEASAFSDCKSLAQITISEGIHKIDSYAFSGCLSLKTIVIPKSVNEINTEAFQGCRSLQSITIPKNVNYIGVDAFANTFFLKENFKNYSSMTGYFGQTIFDNEIDGMCIKNDRIVNARNSYLKKKVIVPDEIVKIEDGTFKDCSSIIQLVCSQNLTHIGNMAFFGCENLTSVSLNDGLNSIGEQAFCSCASLKEITIPASVQFIGTNSFANCSFENGGIINNSNCDWSFGQAEYNVMNDVLLVRNNELIGVKDEYLNFDGHLVVPDGIESINLSFLSQTKISGITIPKSVKKITGSLGSCKTLQTVVINGDIDVISSSIFRSNESISTIEINGNITKIDFEAFKGCRSLTNLKITSPIEEIGKNAFAYCSSLKTVQMPKTLRIIGDAAFDSCVNLKEIEIPDGISELAGNVFVNCRSLSVVKLPDTLQKIGTCAFLNCQKLTNVNFPNVKIIGKRAFGNCTELSSVAFSENTEQIQSEAFVGCTSLKEAKLPKNLTYIGDGAFKSCTSLKNISFPKTLTDIGDEAFRSCTSLKDIDLPEMLCFVGENAFTDTAYYQDNTNWHNNCLYIGNYLIKYKNGVYDKNKLKSDTYGIADRAFQSCKEIASINFPDNVRVLGRELFSFPTHKETLVKFYIPKSVKKIGTSPFELLRCRGSEIYYDGSLEEWVAVEKNGSVFKMSPHKYSCEHPEMEGYVTFKVKDENLNSYKEVTVDDIRQLNTEKISAYSFSNCSQLSGDLIIPENIKQIEKNAFEACNNIENITVNGEITAFASKTFYDCNFVKQVVLPNTTQKIGDSAFESCDTLKSVKLGSQTKTIGQSTFESCPELVAITNNNTVERVENGAFRNCNKLHDVNTWDKLIYIGEESFKNCQQLESFTPSHSLTMIGDLAFSQCTNLKTFTFPKNSKNIGSKLFDQCPSLENVIFKEGISVIPDELFKNCTGLKTVEVGEGTKDIGHRTFSGCSNLKIIKLPRSISVLHSSTFDSRSLENVIYAGSINDWVMINFEGKTTYSGRYTLGSRDSYLHYYFEYPNANSNPCLYSHKLTTTDKDLSSVVLDAAKINNWAFEGLDDVQEIVISSSVKEIEPAAFRNMSGLQKIEVESDNMTYSSKDGVLFNKNKTQLLNYPAKKTEVAYEVAPSVKTISGLAFYGNKNLKNVVVEDTVERIGWGCFGNCSSLESMQLPFVGGIREYITATDISHFSYIFGNKYINDDNMLESNVNFYFPLGSKLSRDDFEMNFSLPLSLKTVIIKNNFDKYDIYPCAFANCSNIENIKLDCNVYSIETYAFIGCNKIKTLHPLDNNNDGLGIKDTLLHIKEAAFCNCDNLTSITLPEHVLTIREKAFYGLKSLTACKLSNALEYICSTDDYNILILNGLGYGGDGMGAFEGCYSLENIVFPSNNLKEIQGYSFANCSKLSSIVLPETLRRAGAFAFYNCKGLQDITINGPTYIGGAAFAEPQKLNSLVLNNEKITEYSEYDRDSNKTSYLGFFQINEDFELSSNTIKASTYQFPITLNHWEKVCDFDNGVVTAGSTGIGKGGEFLNSDKVKSLTFKEGITSIGNDSFYSCPNLEELVLPDSLQTIGTNFLRNGEKLTNVVIPEGVKVIKDGFFASRDVDTLQLPAGLEEFSYNNRDLDVDLFICKLPKDIRKRCSKELLRLTSQSFYTDLTNIKPYTFPSKDKITGQGSVFIGNNTKKIEYEAMDKVNLSTLISFNKDVDMTTTLNAETMNYHDFALKTKHLYAYKDSKLKDIYEKYAIDGEKITYLYDVVYHTDGGEFVDPEFFPEKVYIDKEEIDLSPNVSKAGKIFVGWSNKPNGELIDSIKATKNTDLYAVYKDAKYSISFDANGGEGTTPGMGSDTKENIKLLKNGFYKKGYTFLGWSKDKNAKAPDFLDGAVCSPFGLLQRKVTLYAIWKENKVPAVEEKPVAPEVITINKTYDDKHPEDEPEFAENEGDASADADLDIEQIKKVPKTGDDMYLITIIFGLAGVSLVGTANVLIIISYRKKKNKK